MNGHKTQTAIACFWSLQTGSRLIYVLTSQTKPPPPPPSPLPHPNAEDCSRGTTSDCRFNTAVRRLRCKCDGTRAETRFRLLSKRTRIRVGALISSSKGFLELNVCQVVQIFAALYIHVFGCKLSLHRLYCYYYYYYYYHHHHLHYPLLLQAYSSWYFS